MPSSASNATAELAPRQRSRVTNGRVLLEGIDGNSTTARRFKDLVNSLTADFGGVLSEVERQQVRVAAGAILHAETLTAAVVRGEPIDAEQVTRASNVASRLLAGLKRSRKPKSSAPSVAQYLAAKAGVSV